MCHPARCRRKACQARRSLPRPLRTYVRPPRCHYCGAPLRPDKRGTHKERRYKPCTCTGYPFPHRPGSKHCGPGDGYYRQYFGAPDEETADAAPF